MGLTNAVVSKTVVRRHPRPVSPVGGWRVWAQPVAEPIRFATRGGGGVVRPDACGPTWEGTTVVTANPLSCAPSLPAALVPMSASPGRTPLAARLFWRNRGGTLADPWVGEPTRLVDGPVNRRLA
jgi:hypothetical protein